MLTRRMLLPLMAAGTAACQGGRDAQSFGAGGVGAGGSTLVVVFQRFAADWINLLIPAGDDSYATMRPNIRVDNPLPLDAYFGLHPALAPLQGIYDAGDLAFVTATGWLPQDSRDRSHFFAQQIAESGARAGVRDGWLGRVMQRDAAAQGLWAALAAESSVPVSLQGFPEAIALQDFASYTHGSVMAQQATAFMQSLARLAGEPGAVVERLASSMRDIEQAPPPASEIVYPATTLGRGLKVAAEAIRGGLAPRVVTVTSDDDWDTHVNQVSRHNAALPNFAGALRAFYDDLAEYREAVTLVTMTEFGRKARDNLSGTDHGTAASMLVMGGRVAGGQVYGDWPGMQADALYEGEDLEPTTDFRSVLGEVLASHIGAGDAQLDEIFPGGYAGSSRWRRFLR